MGVITGKEADLVIIACRTQSPEPIRPERCRLCSDMGHGLSTASLFPSYTLPFSHGPPAINSPKFKQAPPKDPWHSFIAFGRLTFLALVFTSFPLSQCFFAPTLPYNLYVLYSVHIFSFQIIISPGKSAKTSTHRSPFTIHHSPSQEPSDSTSSSPNAVCRTGSAPRNDSCCLRRN